MKLLTAQDRELVQRLLAFAGNHPAMLLTLSYFVISFIGLGFSWSFFSHFNIDYFEYAEIGDFLLAAFREPVTFMFLLSATVVGLAVFFFQVLVQAFYRRFAQRWKFVAWLQRIEMKMNPWGVLPSIMALVVVYAAIFIFIYADDKANEIMDGAGDQAVVHLADPIADGILRDEGIMLGNTLRTVFLYNPEQRQVRIIPLEAIVAIDMPSLPSPETKSSNVEMEE